MNGAQTEVQSSKNSVRKPVITGAQTKKGKVETKPAPKPAKPATKSAPPAPSKPATGKQTNGKPETKPLPKKPTVTKAWTLDKNKKLVSKTPDKKGKKG